MIHNVMTSASGDYRDMGQTADALKAANDSIINAYVEKTGMGREELQALMDKETYMSPQQAVDYGFVDKIMFSDGSPQAVPLQNGILISPEAIEKLRGLIKNPDHGDSDFLMQKNKATMQLKLLNLKGGQRT